MSNFTYIPLQNGSWDGECGNSNFFPELSYVPKSISNRESWSWKQILEYYKITCIPFSDGYPVFPEKIVFAEVKIKHFSRLPCADNRRFNFPAADEELAKQKGWSKEEARYYRETKMAATWHEKEDCQTLQLVPIYVHDNIPHRGGVSESKK